MWCLILAWLWAILRVHRKCASRVDANSPPSSWPLPLCTYHVCRFAEVAHCLHIFLVFLYFMKSVFHAEISTTNLTLALCCCNRKAVCADFISSSSSSSSSLSSTNEQTRCRLSHLLFGCFLGIYFLLVCLFGFFFFIDFFVTKQSSIFLQPTLQIVLHWHHVYILVQYSILL